MNAETKERLQRAAERLNRVSDALNESIEEIEDRLQQSNVGVTVWLDVMIDGERFELGYTKLDKRWRIAVRADGETNPLTNVSRGVRVVLVGHIEPMLEALVVRLEELTLQVQAATKKIEVVANGLGA